MNKDKQGIYILIGLVVIALLAAFVATREKEVTIVDSSQNQTVSVTGEAERFIAPDTASVSFTITRKSKNLTEATDSVNKRIADLVKELREEDVKESDIKTTSYSVNPEYNYQNRVQNFDGYRVRQSVEVKIRELDNVNTVLTKIGELQVDNVSGLTFFIDEDKEIKEELRKEAINDAKTKAKKLAKELGVDLDDIVGFSENDNQYPQPFYRDQAFADDGESGAIQATIPAGENEFKSSVTITYKIN